MDSFYKNIRVFNLNREKAMAYCIKCGNKVLEGTGFCNKCGTLTEF